jgi:hypothetical protein
VRLIDARADDVARVAFHWIVVNEESRPSSRLDCRNPG